MQVYFQSLLWSYFTKGANNSDHDCKYILFTVLIWFITIYAETKS